MRYKKNMNKKTPLEEKFDNTNFPFEPAAWSQMERLLADSNTKPKGGFSSTKRIISLLILGVFISLGSAVVLKKDKASLVNQSPFSNSREKVLSPTFIIESTATSQPKELPTSVFSIKNKINEEHNEAISFLENKDKKQVNATSKSWHYDYKTLNYNPNLRRLNTQFTLLNNDDKTTFKNTNTYYNNLFNLKKEKDNFEKNSKNGDLKNEKLLVNALLNDSTTKVLPPQYFEEKTNQKNSNQDIVLDEIYIPLNRKIVSETELLPVYETTEEVTSEYGLDFAPYGWAMDDMKTIKQPLWRGLKNNLYLGIGLVGGVRAYNFKYLRRFTPLLGLGLNYYKADGFYLDKEYIELEGQFFLVHRKSFEFALTIGYGHESGYNFFSSIHPESNSLFTFGAGLEARYLFTEKINLGIRFDGRKEMGNILLQLGIRF
jgi:uncharacterized protein YcfL